MASHPLYGTWYMMMQRCYNPSHDRYHDWGARGIAVCDDWHDVRNYIDWIVSNLGDRPFNMTIDRINNDGNYEPGNVRWATRSMQQLNKRKKLHN